LQLARKLIERFRLFWLTSQRRNRFRSTLWNSQLLICWLFYFRLLCHTCYRWAQL